MIHLTQVLHFDVYRPMSCRCGLNEVPTRACKQPLMLMVQIITQGICKVTQELLSPPVQVPASAYTASCSAAAAAADAVE
jgi:hypothetical protein